MRVGDEAADRRDVDDAALAVLQHVPAEALAGQERALQVERDDGVESVLGKLLGRGAERRAGAVDEHVDPTEPRDDVGDGAVDGRRVGDVRRERCRRPAGGRDRGACLGGAIGVHVDDGDRRARLRETGGDRSAEPTRPTGDHRDAVLEAEEARDEPGGKRC